MKKVCKWTSHEMFGSMVYVKTDCGHTVGGDQNIPTNDDGSPGKCYYCRRLVEFEVGEDDDE